MFLLAQTATLPDWETLWRVLTLQDYNTRLVVLAVFCLGLAAGLVGSFLLLRKRSLMGDALSHATLPGIGLAFIVMVVGFGASGKSLPGLLLGATVLGLLGLAVVIAITRTTRIKDDAAMGIVLSVFFGLGIAILRLTQDIPGASAAGLEHFIYGKAAAMVQQDLFLIVGIAVACIVGAVLFTKEFSLVAFDESFGRAEGWPVGVLDAVMLMLVTAVTVAGLQAVGLILIIAFLIIPAAAARFWTDDLRKLLFLAALIGGASGWLGATLSALLPKLPAGSIIVLAAAALFLVSMFFGTARGVLRRQIAQARLRRKIGRQHLLRAIYEIQESICAREKRSKANVPVPLRELLQWRSWTPKRVRKLLRRASREDHIERLDEGSVVLSEAGYGEAARITRNHRLWEIFLITHAEIAADHVDRDADSVEHVLSPEMVRELEDELDTRNVPVSPHPLKESPA